MMTTPITGNLEQIQDISALSQDERLGSTPTLGKDDYLRLFVTKLANQDPLNPMEDEAFIAQLAQFSQLEQLKNMNDNLKESTSWSLLLSQTINNTMATSLLGRTVRVDTSTVALGESGDATIRYDLPEPAANVTIEITTADGDFVRALRADEASAGANEIYWDGKDANGNELGQGKYDVTIRAEDADGNPITARTYFSGEVDSVRYVEGQAMLTIGDVMVSLGDVIEVTAADE
jgi:flagellar basal-body rod modification protein FlgD